MFFSGLVLNIIMHFRACNFRSLAKMWPSKITHFSNGLSKSLYPRNNYTCYYDTYSTHISSYMYVY